MVEVRKKHLVVLLKQNNDNVSVNLSGLVKVKAKKEKELSETVLTLYFNFKIMTLAIRMIYF